MISSGPYGATEFPYESSYPMTSQGVTSGLYGDPLYPFDSQYPWQHGYFQEISPYSGYHYFKPYNYRHVLSQTQTAAGWGITPQLAYSQQFLESIPGTGHLEKLRPASLANRTSKKSRKGKESIRRNSAARPICSNSQPCCRFNIRQPDLIRVNNPSFNHSQYNRSISQQLRDTIRCPAIKIWNRYSAS